MAGHRLKHSFLALDHKLFTGTDCDSRREFSGYCNAENQGSAEGNMKLFELHRVFAVTRTSDTPLKWISA